MKDKKTKILTLLTIILIIIIIGVLTVLIINKKEDNNKKPSNDITYNRDYVYDYVSKMYSDNYYDIVVDEDEEYCYATVSLKEEVIIKLVFDKKNKTIFKDSTGNEMSASSGYDPNLEEDNNE